MSNSQERTRTQRRRGPMGHGMQPGEKPKNLKKSVKQLAKYMATYKIGIFVVMILCGMLNSIYSSWTKDSG